MAFLVYMAHINDHFLCANLRHGAWLTCWDACTWCDTATLLLLIVMKSVFSQNRNITETSRVSVWCVC